MRIIVTGVSGHVGGAVAAALREDGHDVTGVSRSRPSVQLGGAELFTLDITAPDFCDRLVHRVGSCDAVIHAAACIDGTAPLPEIIRINCLGTAQVLEAARQLQAGCIVYLSSLSILGKPCVHPVTEEHPLAPGTAYAVSKLAGEQLTLLADSAPRAVSLRISSPVGPGLRHKRIFHVFVERAKQRTPLLVNGTGARRQDYVDVRDIARAVKQVLESECSGVYNLGAGKPTSNLELARLCVKTLHSSSEIVMTGVQDPEDDVCWDLCIDKAARDFGYLPRYPLERSVADLAASLP